MFTSSKKKLVMLIAAMLVILGISTPTAQAKPVEYPVGTAQVSLVLYQDMNGDGYLNPGGYDWCIRSDSTPLHSWLMTQSSTGINYIVSTPLGTDFRVSTYNDYLTCVNNGHKFSVPSNQYYDLSGCGPYPRHVWIGYTNQGEQLDVTHRVNSTDPSC